MIAFKNSSGIAKKILPALEYVGVARLFLRRVVYSKFLNFSAPSVKWE